MPTLFGGSLQFLNRPEPVLFQGRQGQKRTYSSIASPSSPKQPPKRKNEQGSTPPTLYSRDLDCFSLQGASHSNSNKLKTIKEQSPYLNPDYLTVPASVHSSAQSSAVSLLSIPARPPTPVGLRSEIEKMNIRFSDNSWRTFWSLYKPKDGTQEECKEFIRHQNTELKALGYAKIIIGEALKAKKRLGL